MTASGSGSDPADGETGGAPKRRAPRGLVRPPPADPPGRRPFAVLGCLMTVAGFFSGAMIAVLVAKVYSGIVHCVPPDSELPACNWERFAAVGGILGALSLPALIYWRLRTPRGRANAPEKGDL